MKTLTIGATRPISEKNTPLAPQIKAAALKAVRTVLNPWFLTAVGIAIALIGILLFNVAMYKTGAVIGGLSISVALMRVWFIEMKGGEK